MRIKIIREPSQQCIDGMQLTQFRVGQQYVVGTALGALLLCEGWAEPVDDDSPELLIPVGEPGPERDVDDPPPNLVRDVLHSEKGAIAMDRGRRRRWQK